MCSEWTGTKTAPAVASGMVTLCTNSSIFSMAWWACSSGVIPMKPSSLRPSSSSSFSFSSSSSLLTLLSSGMFWEKQTLLGGRGPGVLILQMFGRYANRRMTAKTSQLAGVFFFFFSSPHTRHEFCKECEKQHIYPVNSSVARGWQPGRTG